MWTYSGSWVVWVSSVGGEVVVGAGVAREKGLWRLRFLNRLIEDLVREGREGCEDGALVTLLVVSLLMFLLRKKEDFLARLRDREVVGARVVGWGSEDFLERREVRY